MTSTMRMITSSAVWAVLAAPALAHPGHGDSIGHTHGVLDALGVQAQLFALIVLLFIAMRIGGHAMRRYVRQS
jgi:hypothetical protein